MKKVVPFILLLLAIVPANAQTESKENSKSWFVGGQLGPTFAIADNITDHPTFKYFSDALGFGFNVYAGKYFTPKIGCRAGLGFSNVKNRGNAEFVSTPEFKSAYSGNGFYSFGVFDLYADALFDFTNICTSRNHPLHFIGFAGLGMLSTSNYKLKDYKLKKDDKFSQGVLGVTAPSDAGTYLAFRLGFILDYRLSPNVSLNFEGNLSITNDNFDGIDYDEPFDMVVDTFVGVTYYF